MSEMIERVMRAACKGSGLCKYVGDKCNTTRCTVTPEGARAAVEAMREPTEAMWRAWRSVNCKIGTDGMEEFTYFSGDYGSWLACHRAMIDAALTEE